MRVVSQNVLAIEHDETVDRDWNLTLQRLELESGDVPHQPDRTGETFDALTLRVRGAGSGGGRVDDVSVPLDEVRTFHPVPLGKDLFGLVGTAPHDRFSSAQLFVETESGSRMPCHMVSKPDYAVEFFVALSVERPTSLEIDVSGMSYRYPVHWPE